jgi:nucleotide-binding universal stress UspA family protein
MKILIAHDGSAFGGKALDHVLSPMAPYAGAEIELIHIAHAVPARAASAVGAEIVAAHHAHEHDEALSGACARLAAAGRTAREHRLVGDPASKIIETLAAGGYDLVVMGSHGHGTVAGFLLGSVVTKVLARSPVPVLVVR